ncbi:MAG TPA: hypothetical protein PKE63_10835 [Lacibacter sp.]|nr:hypothetical protein [Lacibacter sp.]HMO87827.1 hypothetical protein [Lacibacter sp.]HMP87765.1 hypothetical protein [Lacibacter sp.]
MKYVLALLFSLSTLALAAQQAPAPKKPAAAAPAPKPTNKYNDNVDDRMKGPNGEKIYIGPNGGRYYLKGDRKVYVEYKGNKKKKKS